MLSLSAFIAIAMTSAVLFWYKYNQNKEQAIETLSQTVGIMGENLSASIEFDDAESAKTILSALKINDDIDGAYILKDEKTLFASYIRNGVDEKALKQKISSICSGGGIKNDIKQIDFDNIAVSKPIYLKGKYLASFLIVSNTKGIKNTLQTQLYIQVATLIVVLMIIVLLAFKLQKIFTTPIFKLKAAMDDVRVRGNLDTHIDFSSNDEFQSLVDGFKGMLKTIKEQKNQLEHHAQTLNETIKIKTADIEKQKNKLESMLATVDKNVIYSQTDLKGNIEQVSKAFCKISGYAKEELIGKPHNAVRHPDMPKSVFAQLWKTIQAGNVWKGEVKNQKKDGGFYWVYTVISPEYDENHNPIGYSAIRHDITAEKDAEELSAKLQEQLIEIQRFQNLTAGREARMVELKNEINEYALKLSCEPPYAVVEDSEVIDAASETEIAEEPNLKELLDSERLQMLMEYFYSFMHIPLAIIDLEANILVQSKWQKACTDFHRVNEESCKRCIESDIDIGRQLQNGEKFTIHKCKNGLTDCASPIIINGKHLANFFIGQFMVSEPDMEFFTAQAKRYGYDVGEYMEAIKDVPIVDETKLADILGFLVEITNMVTSLTIEKMNAKRSDKANTIKAEEMRLGKIAALNLAEDANNAKKELIAHQEHLEELIEERTRDLNDERSFVNSVINSQNNFVVSTDGVVMKSANSAMLRFYDVGDIGEFIAKFGMCICDTFKTDAPDGFLQKSINGQKWIDYVCDNPAKIHKVMIEKESQNYIFTVTATRFRFKDEELSVAVFTDITELEKIREEVERILENILLPVLITSKKERVILYANKYAEHQYERPTNELVGSNIDDIYTTEGQSQHIIDALSNNGKVENFEEVFKTATGKEFIALLSVTPIIYNNEEAYIGMVTDITKQKEVENEIRMLHKHTKESIEYASLIQHSLIPSGDAIRAHFGEYFVIWHPKDIVGGDIYFFEELEDGAGCILFVIDCTGHGVPGAFVSMLVKAIERQVTSQIRLRNETVSPAKLLAVFNKSMKNLLKQESDDAISNAGFDGAIIYHNKQTGVLKFAGAQTPLFYVEDGELKTIKGDRQSIGYKKSDGNFEFTEHVIKTKPGMCFYVVTDGYLDQNGGDKGFPFGKKRFSSIIEEYHAESFADQQEIFLNELYAYQKDEIRNDDITLIGFKI